MNFNEYQLQARTTAIYPDKGNNLVYPTLGLVNEAGEVAGKIKKLQRDDGNVLTDERRGSIIDEAGDVLWYLSNLASELNVTLEEVAARNLDKLSGRAARGVLQGDGDKR